MMNNDDSKYTNPVEVLPNKDVEYNISIGNKIVAIYLSDFGGKDRLHIREMVPKVDNETGDMSWTYTPKAVMIPMEKIPEFVMELLKMLNNNGIKYAVPKKLNE